MPRFDTAKYLREAQEEATVPEWSMLVGAVLVVVLAVVVLWGAFWPGGSGSADVDADPSIVEEPQIGVQP